MYKICVYVWDYQLVCVFRNLASLGLKTHFSQSTITGCGLSFRLDHNLMGSVCREFKILDTYRGLHDSSNCGLLLEMRFRVCSI